MRRKVLVLLVVVLTAVTTVVVSTGSATASDTYRPPELRQSLDLDKSWRFFRADVSGAPAPSYGSAPDRPRTDGRPDAVPAVRRGQRRGAGRWSPRTSPVAELKVYSNAVAVSASLNGVGLGSLTSADHVFRWPVALRRGANVVTVSATIDGHSYTDSVVDPCLSRSARWPGQRA